MFLLFFWESGEASQMRVCYQRGLPHFVSYSNEDIKPSMRVIHVTKNGMTLKVLKCFNIYLFRTKKTKAKKMAHLGKDT